MKKFRFKTIGVATNRGRILQKIYQKGEVKKWVKFDKSGGTARSRERDTSSIAELRRQGLVETCGGGRVFEVKITEKGIIECLKLELILTDILPEGLFCLVVFDIPESKRELRDAFRIFLRDNCFLSLQKSVWISQFNMVELLEKLFLFWKIEKWAKVYIVYEEAGLALKNFGK
jgi:hypothetical protein